MIFDTSLSPPTPGVNTQKDSMEQAQSMIPLNSRDIAHSGQSPIDDIEKQTAKNLSPEESAFRKLSLLDRFLALWIFFAMLIGILLGNFVPNTGPALQKGKFVGVSIPIGTCSPQKSGSVSDSLKAVGLLLMMYPILCKVKFETIHLAFRQRSIWIQIVFSIVVNWLLAPFLMVIPSLLRSIGHR